MTEFPRIDVFDSSTEDAQYLGDHLVYVGEPKVVYSKRFGMRNKTYAAIHFGYNRGHKNSTQLNFPIIVSQIMNKKMYKLLNPSTPSSIDLISPNGVDFGVSCYEVDIDNFPPTIAMLEYLIKSANYLIKTTDTYAEYIRKSGVNSSTFDYQVSLDPRTFGKKMYFVG